MEEGNAGRMSFGQRGRREQPGRWSSMMAVMEAECVSILANFKVGSWRVGPLSRGCNLKQVLSTDHF